MLFDSTLRLTTIAEKIHKNIRKGQNPHFAYGLDSSLYASIASAAISRVGAAMYEDRLVQIASIAAPKILDAGMSAAASSHMELVQAIEAELSKEHGSLTLPFELFQSGNSPARALEFVTTPRSLLEATDASHHLTLRLCIINKESQELLEQFFKGIQGKFDRFFDQQLDLPGVNSLVRHGLVKAFRFPDETVGVAKRSNPSKPGRLELDIENSAIMKKRIIPGSNAQVVLRRLASGKELHVSVIQPEAVVAIPETQTLYAISRLREYPTLEHVLATEQLSRAELLESVKHLVGELYQHGILWGDCAPRNILVERSANAVHLHLLDFEKMQVLDGAVPFDRRVEHARGPMCVEEFGAVCSRDEVEKTFEPYFNPSSWSVEEKGAIPFTKPKREIVDFLKGRGVTKPDFGTYNAAELQVTKARFPGIAKDGKIFFPTYVNFKIDHYLGADYDRKTNELLMSAADFGVLEECVAHFESLLKNVEHGYLRRELSHHANVTHRSTSLQDDLGPAKKCVDELYALKDDKTGFIHTVKCKDVDTMMLNMRNQYLHTPSAGSEMARSGWQRIKPSVLNATEKARVTLPNDAVVLLAGGADHDLFSVGSDLDFAIIGASEAVSVDKAQAFARSVNAATGIDVEVMPHRSLQSLRESLLAAEADDIADLKNARVLYGNKKDVDALSSRLVNLAQDRKIVGRLETWYPKLSDQGATSARNIHNAIKSAGYLNKPLPENLVDERVNAVLLYQKTEEKVAAKGLTSTALIAPQELAQISTLLPP